MRRSKKKEKGYDLNLPACSLDIEPNVIVPRQTSVTEMSLRPSLTVRGDWDSALASSIAYFAGLGLSVGMKVSKVLVASLSDT